MSMTKKGKIYWGPSVVILMLAGAGALGFIFLEKHERKEKEHHGSYVRRLRKP